MTHHKTYPTAIEEAYSILRKRLDQVANSCFVSEEEAEDIIQEGFLRLADKEIDSKKEAYGKFWKTVRNIAVDRFRHRKFSVSLNSLSHDISDNEDRYVDGERLIQQMQSLLSPLQNRIMTMLVRDELDYPEIASILKINEGTVRTNVSRARKLLKEKLER